VYLLVCLTITTNDYEFWVLMILFGPPSCRGNVRQKLPFTSRVALESIEIKRVLLICSSMVRGTPAVTIYGPGFFKPSL
jgi:hypothetical protein